MTKTITIRNIPFEFVETRGGALILVNSDYCKDSLLVYLKSNMPDDIAKIPELVETVERLIDKFEGES